MNDETHIEELGLKHLDFIQQRLKEIELRMDQMVSEGLYQKTQRNLGILPFPEKMKEYAELMKLRIRFERRQSELLDKPYEPDPRDGLSAGEALAFDKGAHWARWYDKHVSANKGHDHDRLLKRVILLEGEAIWESEGDNVTRRKDLLKKFDQMTTDQWRKVASKFDIVLPKQPGKVSLDAMEDLFRKANKLGWIKVPRKALYAGKPKK
jgi:hypothetical protein